MIRPCIVFEDRCEEAVNFYVSIFPNSKILDIQRSPSDGPIAKGKVMGCTWQLDGREYLSFDGGPDFKFSQAFSLMVMCKTQDEVDRYWAKLLEGGGEEVACGWLTDRFGVSWQIVPEVMLQMLSDRESGNSDAAFQAMLKMKKLDIAELERAYRGSGVA